MDISATHDPDAACMLAYRAGDTASFDRILQRYRDPLFGFLLRFVRNRAVAEELAQEVFLRVCNSPNYSPTAKFQSWLYRIATNLALNWVRDHRAERNVVSIDYRSQEARRTEVRCRERNIEEQLIFESRLEQVRAVIDDLPERYRTAVLMHKYSEMEYWEIADALGCSVPALKSLLFRAYELLRIRLAHLDPQRRPAC